MTSHRIAPRSGYAPTIGRLVDMLTYARETTLSSVAGLSRDELDHLHDPASNSIGALLAHVTAVERWYQVLTFSQRQPSPNEEAEWVAALDLGDAGRRHLRGRALSAYLEEMTAVRQVTLSALAARGDDWLEQPLTAAPAMNAHWAWFHVMEDELSHRGQIRWLRSRLPGGRRE